MPNKIGENTAEMAGGKIPVGEMPKDGKDAAEKSKEQKPLPFKIMVIVAAAVVVARMLSNLFASYQVDMGVYKSWCNLLADSGPGAFFQNTQSVYGPVYMYFLWFTGRLSRIFSMNDAVLDFFVKFWPTLSDLIGGYIIYLIGKKYQKERIGFILGVVYALNPAIIVNSSVWGQFDSVPATMVLAALYFYNTKRNVAAAVMYTLVILTKPQAVFFAPAIAILFFKGFSLKNKASWKALGQACAGILISYTLALLPFFRPGAKAGHNPLRWLLDFVLWIPNHYLKSAGDYPYATANGFNLWTVLNGQAVMDNELYHGLSYTKWGVLLFAVVALLAVWLMIKKNKSVLALYYSAFFLYFGAFMFVTRMHERYLVPAIVFITVCILWDAKLWVPMVLLSAACFLNQWHLYDMSWHDEFWVAGDDRLARYVAIGSLVVMAYAVYYIIALGLKKRKKKVKVSAVEAPSEGSQEGQDMKESEEVPAVEGNEGEPV